MVATREKPSPAERLAAEKAKGSGTFVSRLRDRRESLGLSLRDVAEGVGGITHVSLQHWELGLCHPTLTHAYALARFYGVSVYDLWPDVPAEKAK